MSAHDIVVSLALGAPLGIGGGCLGWAITAYLERRREFRQFRQLCEALKQLDEKLDEMIEKETQKQGNPRT